MFERLIMNIGDAVGSWLYVIAGAIAFAEASIMLGMFFPGETALLVAGVFCQKGVLSLWLMIPIAVGCAIAGDSIGYEFGKKFGPRLRQTRIGRWVGEHRWSKMDGFLCRHGGKAVLLGRLTALARALVPGLAGMCGMRYRTFLLWNATGGLLWGAGCVLLGYAFASALDVVGKTLTWAPIAIIAVVVLVAGAHHLRHHRIEAAEEAQWEAARADVAESDV